MGCFSSKGDTNAAPPQPAPQQPCDPEPSDAEPADVVLEEVAPPVQLEVEFEPQELLTVSLAGVQANTMALHDLFAGATFKINLECPVELIARCMLNVAVKVTQHTDVGRILRDWVTSDLNKVNQTLDRMSKAKLGSAGRTLSTLIEKVTMFMENVEEGRYYEGNKQATEELDRINEDCTHCRRLADIAYGEVGTPEEKIAAIKISSAAILFSTFTAANGRDPRQVRIELKTEFNKLLDIPEVRGDIKVQLREKTAWLSLEDARTARLKDVLHILVHAEKFAATNGLQPIMSAVPEDRRFDTQSLIGTGLFDAKPLGELPAESAFHNYTGAEKNVLAALCGQPWLPLLPCNAVSIGDCHVLAITKSGQLSAGKSKEAKMGQCDVPTLPLGQCWVAVGTGLYHSLGLTTTGQLLAWGRNKFGQCDVPALPAGQRWAAVHGGYSWSAGLTSEGQILAWGEVKDGVNNPPALPEGQRWAAFATGYHFIVGLTSAGQLRAWGYNYFKQCTTVPQLPAGQRWAAFAAGGNHCLALTAEGQLHAWGEDDKGQCQFPTLPVGQRWANVAGGSDHSLGLTTMGRLFAWGNNEYGQCDVPALPAGQRWAGISAWSRTSAGLTITGEMYLWGHKWLAELQDWSKSERWGPCE